MSFSSNNTNQKKRIISKELVELRKSGFKLVPLSENGTPAIDNWTPIYENPNYWNDKDFNDPSVCSKFHNIASTLGKTHIKDQGQDLYLKVLDIDSEKAFTLVNTPMSQLAGHVKLVSKFHSIFVDSWNISEKEFSEYTILNVLKMFTFVTKTRKPWGYHIWWLSHNQNTTILKEDCKIDSVFEIFTDKHLCTLPPSTHRDDKKFNYSWVGRTDKILLCDDLYTIFVELFKDCLKDDYHENKNKENVNESEKVKNRQLTNIKFYDLSPQTIQASVDYLLPYYIEHDRNNFVLAFSGMTFYSHISEESAKQIIEKICDGSKDTEKKNRITTLKYTYKDGYAGQPITGAPTLADLIANLKDYDKQLANDIVNNLKTLWNNDIYHKKNPDEKKESAVPRELSVGQAKREKSGFVEVKGTIIGLTPVYNMISSVEWRCSDCGYDAKIDFEQPIFRLPSKDTGRCMLCPKGQNSGTSLSVIPKYVSVVDLELQDLETFSEIERLSVKVFEKNTYDVTAGEVVKIVGHVHVIRKNDNPHNKLETVLFADSLEYEKRDDFILTDKDKLDLENWKLGIENQDKNVVDELTKLFAPEIIGLEIVKKGMLLVSANAGLRNIENRLPKRLRLNALLIGDPGLAKTGILQKVAKLVPNSQYAGGQSSTGLSLTSQVSKEDGGTYTLRFGPIVLAKNALCCINELGQLPISEHKHLLDCMEENGFPIAKYGFTTTIEAHPSIIASANPINNKWENEEVANFAEFPTLSQIIDRFDLIFVLRENKDPEYLQKYVEEKKKVCENYKAGLYEGNEEFIKKYIAYARTFKPVLTNDAYSLLKEFYINMGYSGISGLPRKFDSLIRITVAIAKLKLKNTADLDDAEEAMMFYNKQLEYFNWATRLATHPRDIAYSKIKEIVKEKEGLPILLTNAAIEASVRDQDTKYYLLGQGKFKNKTTDTLKLNNSYQLKQILILLRNDDTCIQIIQEKPMTVRWKKVNEEHYDKLSEPNIDYKKEANHAIIDKITLDSEKQKTQVIPEYPNQMVKQCDECDECDEENKLLSKGIIPINKDNIVSKDDGINVYKEKNDKLTLKSIISDVDNPKSNNLAEATGAITSLEKENKDENSIESLNKNEKSSSHTSHSSHTFSENSSQILESENLRTKTKSDNSQESDRSELKSHIQLKYPPNAEVFTNETIHKILGSKVQQSNEDNPSTSDSNVE